MGIKLVRDKITKLQYADKCNDGFNGPKDILDIIIEHLADKISEEELVDNFVTMFIAGQETTANTLAFLFYLYGKHPEVYRKVCEEVQSITFDQENSTKLSASHLASLKYTEATLKESLRLYPPAFATTRENVRAAKISGYQIPKDSIFMINFAVMHRLHFRNANDFIPERFLEPSSGESSSNNCYMPFSLGPRSCVGRHFAIDEAKVIIFKLIKNFHFLPDLSQSFDVDEGIVLKLVDGIKVFVQKSNC